MGLETGTYIDSLNPSNPAATDALSQADEHLRLLKSTIKATFPNVDAAVTATPTDLNTKTALISDGTNVTFNTGITADKVKTLIGAVEPAINASTAGDGSVTPLLATGITAAEVRALIGAAEASTASTLLGAYPVGSIYTSVAGTNPATFFGGTWVAFGQGKVVVGLDLADTDFDTVENTGGAKTHTLTTAEMPSHTHSMTIEDSSGTGSTGSSNGASSFSTVDTSSTGGDGAHNNLQPYVVVYMWKRTV